MKAIISHDVDHLKVSEHMRDLIVPKFIFRSVYEMVAGYGSLPEYGHRLRDLVRNRWQNIAELAEFDSQMGIPSTFFVGVARGRGMSYSTDDAGRWIRYISDKGFDVGAHGLSHADRAGIGNEVETFRKLSGLRDIGIRMHYLKFADETLGMLEEVGYLFDSSVYELKDPYRAGRIWEFPLHVMDGYVFYESRWRCRSIEEAKDFTKRIVDEVADGGMKYLTVLFHDRYYCEGFRLWKEWYHWLVRYLKEGGIGFTNYTGALGELSEAQ